MGEFSWPLLSKLIPNYIFVKHLGHGCTHINWKNLIDEGIGIAFELIFMTACVQVNAILAFWFWPIILMQGICVCSA